MDALKLKCFRVINNCDDSHDFIIGDIYELKPIKKVKHSDNYKAILSDRYGDFEVNTNLKDNIVVSGRYFLEFVG